MKAANFLNVLLAVALVLVCAKLHFLSVGCGTKSCPCACHTTCSAVDQARAETARVSDETTRIADEHEQAAAATHAATSAEAIATATPAPAAPESVVIDSTGLAPDANGFGGPVPVVVEVRDGRVVRVEPKLPNDETPGFFARLEEAGLWHAWDNLPVEVAATTRVDAVTSATYSSEAAIANVRAALATATSRRVP